MPSCDFLDRLARDGDDVVYVLLEGVVVRDDEELLEVAHLPYLLREAFAPLGVHVDGRLVEERDAYVRELLQEREPDRERGDHLLAAREAGERALVPALFEQNVVVLRPAQRAPALARYLSEEQVGVNRDVVEVALGDERPGLSERVAYEVGRGVQLFQTLLGAELFAHRVAHFVEPRDLRGERSLALARRFELRVCRGGALARECERRALR